MLPKNTDTTDYLISFVIADENTSFVVERLNILKNEVRILYCLIWTIQKSEVHILYCLFPKGLLFKPR